MHIPAYYGMLLKSDERGNSPIMSEEQVYTVEEAAKLLKVSKDTIRRMIKRKELDAVKVGGQIRIKAASLHKYL